MDDAISPLRRGGAPDWGRPTLYRGVRMRSRLEAWFAALWDEQGWPWEYEPCAFARGYEQYLPDFLIVTTFPNRPEPIPFYIEVKGRVVDLGATQRRMEIIWDSEPEVDLALTDGDRIRWRGQRGKPWLDTAQAV